LEAQCVSPTRADASGPEAAPGIRSEIRTGSQVEVAQRTKAMAAQFDQLEAKPGSQEVLMAEVRYAIVFGEMNELFFGRLHRLLLAVVIFAGIIAASGGLGTLIAKEAAAAGVTWLAPLSFWSLLLAAIAEALRRAFAFDKREAKFRKAKEEFQDLEGKGWSMAQGTLQKEIAKLRKNAPSGGSWLASSAFNRACEELGHPERHRRVAPHVQFLQHALAS
jgi:hypothetical protein